jgi:hypothetical protein
MKRATKILLIAKGLHAAHCADADRDRARHKLPPVQRWGDPWDSSGCGVLQQRALLRDAEIILATVEAGAWYRRLGRLVQRATVYDCTSVIAAAIACACAIAAVVGAVLGAVLLALVLASAPAVACPEGQGDYYTDAKQGLCEDLEEMDQYRRYNNDDQQYQHRRGKGKKKDG